MPLRRIPFILIVCLACSGLSSCLVKRRLITRAGGKVSQTLLVATRAELEQKIEEQYEAVHDFNATFDMTPALGSAEKSQITEYKDVRGFILFRKPAEIRIIGLYPVVRNTAFDMVSTGNDFKLYLPSQNRFLIGRNEVIRPSRNKIENLRPRHFLEALLVQPLAPGERTILENYTDEENAFYILHVVQESGAGQLELMRTVWFSRLDLRLARQIILDPMGNILTDARYSKWGQFESIDFPKHIEINRPRDEYAVVLDVVKMDINKGVSDDKFVLNQPEGTKLQMVGESSTATPAEGSTR